MNLTNASTKAKSFIATKYFQTMLQHRSYSKLIWAPHKMAFKKRDFLLIFAKF